MDIKGKDEIEKDLKNLGFTIKKEELRRAYGLAFEHPKCYSSAFNNYNFLSFQLEKDGYEPVLWHIREMSKRIDKEFSEDIYTLCYHYACQYFVELAKDKNIHVITFSTKLLPEKALQFYGFEKQNMIDTTIYGLKEKMIQILNGEYYLKKQAYLKQVEKALESIQEKDSIIEITKKIFRYKKHPVSIYAYGNIFNFEMEYENKTFYITEEITKNTIEIRNLKKARKEIENFLTRTIQTSRIDYLFEASTHHFFEWVRKTKIDGIGKALFDYIKNKLKKSELEEVIAIERKRRIKLEKPLTFQSKILEGHYLIQLGTLFLVYHLADEKIIYHYREETIERAVDIFQQFLMEEVIKKMEKEKNEIINYIVI